MSVKKLIARLRDQDIRVWTKDGLLHFDAPQGALTSELRDELRAHKAELIAFLEQASSASRPSRPPISPRATPQAPVSLSFAQQRLWLLDQISGGATYTMPVAVHLEGQLDTNALQRSLALVVERHEVLRSTIQITDDQPLQVIGPIDQLELETVDLRETPAETRTTRAQLLADAHIRQPFDLARGPLLRALLLQLDEHEHMLVLALHHIAADGWSLRVLIREVAAIYTALREDRPPELPILPVQYADYAHWQRQWLQGEERERLLAYWRDQLGQAEYVLDLPTDRPRTTRGPRRGASHGFTLTPDLVAQLEALGHHAGATLFMVLLAGFQILLSRISGQHMFCVGTPVANRDQPELAGLIGCFINTLVLRCDITSAPSFRALLSTVRETALQAYAHQDLPFEQLVDTLQPERNTASTPLFQVLFDLQDAPDEDLHLPGLMLRRVDLDPGTAKFDLSLAVIRSLTGLSATLRYDADLFNHDTVARMADQLIWLLEQVANAPDRPITELELLRPAQRAAVLAAQTGPTVLIDPQPLHILFAARTAAAPERVAIEFNDLQISYGELDRRANQLAHYLRGLGVGPETRVALACTPAPELLVAVLGVLKAGAAYLPLDPDSPPQRSAFMLADANVAVLLTANGAGTALRPDPAGKQHPSYTTLDLVEDWPRIASHPTSPPSVAVVPEQLAYVLYTSGSTGQPKGTMISHKSLGNYLGWVNQTLIDQHLRCIPAITKLSFDASLKQLLAPLLRGDAVWLIPGELVAQPARLLQRLITRRQIGINCVPSLWQAMVELILSGQVLLPADAELSLLLGGEHLTPELVDQSFETLPGLRLWNVYGPTETTANASAGLVARPDLITLGQPLANTQLYVLNHQMRLLPPGIPGELYIGGVGLARGYLDRPDLTAERFIPNPFVQAASERGHEANDRSETPTSSSRLYKTGDRARYLPDGSIEFLGRVDHQVKLRGFRVELGEIEAVLTQHPAVVAAVAVVATGVIGDARLVAYIVPAKAADSETHAAGLETWGLKAYLREHLPEYMIPAAFVLLEALPLLPNGKIDRRALPSPDQAISASAAQYVAPSTPIEQALAHIWAELLGVARVGVQDNFFELGGHSLLATQVLARVRQLYQVTPSLQSLFERPTIASLAAAIEAEQRSQSTAPATGSIQRIARRSQRAQQMLARLDQLSDDQARELLREQQEAAKRDTSHD